MTMPVSPMFRNSWPSLSRSLVPSLALSWSSRCRILRRAWTMTCFFALFVPSASISTGLCLWLRVAAAFSSLRAAPRAPCLRMWSPFSCARSFMGLRRPVLRWVRSVPMTFVVSLPRWRSTVTGRSPRCLTRPHGAPVRCLPPSTCMTFSMSFKVFARWVRSWLRVALTSSRFALGEEEALCCPCLRCSVACFSYWLWWLAPSSSCSGLGVSHFCFYSVFIVLFSLCFFSLFVLCVSQPKMFRGVVLFGHMT